MTTASPTIFILGAGLGTRLRPITDSLPKVMVPIAEGVPLLQHTLLHLRDQGFSRFVINLHYLPDIIPTYFGDGHHLGLTITYSDERDQLMDTAGALKKAASHLGGEFIMLYGDTLHFFDVAALYRAHQQSGHHYTVVLKKSDHPQNGDLARIDPLSKRVVEWVPRPHDKQEYGDAYLLNAGIYILNKSVLDLIPPDIPYNLDRDVIPQLLKRGDYLSA